MVRRDTIFAPTTKRDTVYTLTKEELIANNKALVELAQYRKDFPALLLRKGYMDAYKKQVRDLLSENTKRHRFLGIGLRRQKKQLELDAEKIP